MTDAARTALGVTLLGDNPAARKLLVAWAAVDRSLCGRALHVAWGKAAGVPPSVVARLGPLLLTHELARSNGEIDGEAARVVAHLAAQELRSTRRNAR